MLFWKGAREAYELEEGYGASESRALKKAWTEDEEDELKYLYEENKNIYIEGQDVADIIQANLNKRRSKLQIISALKRLGLIESAKDLKPQLRKEWQEAEIIDLQNVFDDHKTSDDVMGHILNGLSIKRSRKAIVEKLLELNLIQDRKEVLKKRPKKTKNNPNGSGSESADMYSDLDEDVQWSEKNKSNRDESSDDDAEANFFRNLKAEQENINGASNNFNEDGHEIKSLSETCSEKEDPQKRNSTKLWDESEIIELHRIFEENREKDDILGVILNSLSVKRSKQSVIEKLLEIGLIKDKKEIKKKKNARLSVHDNKNNFPQKYHTAENETSISNNVDLGDTNRKKARRMRQILSDDSDNELIEGKNGQIIDYQENKGDKQRQSKKRLPKVWDEQEIIELQKLFQESKDNADIVGNIMLKQTVKRPKPFIIEKLLELGLINDRKEVRKKRERKNGKTKEDRNKAVEESSDEDVPLTLITDKYQNTNRDSSSEQIFKPNRASNTSDKKKVQKEDACKAWEEQEIMELHKLFQDNKNVCDILGTIIPKMTTKRTKKSVVKKLLEVGLINNSKELKRKNDKHVTEDIDKAEGIPKTPNIELKNKHVLSDSDNETLPLSNLLSSKTQDSHNETDSFAEHLSGISNTSNDSIPTLPLNVTLSRTPVHDTFKTTDLEFSDDESLLTVTRKRKRVRIDDSDYSDSDQLHNFEVSNAQKELDPGDKQDVPISLKKRVRVLESLMSQTSKNKKM